MLSKKRILSGIFFASVLMSANSKEASEEDSPSQFGYAMARMGWVIWLESILHNYKGTVDNNGNYKANGTAALQKINVLYPKPGFFYMLVNPYKPTFCIAIDEYKSGRFIEGVTLGTYSSCNFQDKAFQFELIPMTATNGNTSPGSGDQSASDCVQIVNRYSGGCLTVANNYNEGASNGGEIEGAPVKISGCGPRILNNGKAKFQAWRIKEATTMWIETCSLSTTKYLGRLEDGVQKGANLVVHPWSNWATQGWIVMEPTDTDVNTSIQYGCGNDGSCWVGGAGTQCGANKWCYTTSGSKNFYKCSKKYDCIAHVNNRCFYSTCESF